MSVIHTHSRTRFPHFRTVAAAIVLAALPPLAHADDTPAPKAPASHSLSGRITQPDGKPAAEAKVTLVATPSDSEGPGASLSEWRRQRPGDDPPPPEFLTATTDAEGKFSLAVTNPGPWNLRAEASGFAPAYLDKQRAGKTPVAVTLEKGLALAGSVHDQTGGAAIEGARIVAVPALNHGFSDPKDPDRFATLATSGATGAYTLDGLVANFYTIRVSATGKALAVIPRRAVDPAQTDPLDVFLERGFAASGRVLDKSQKGVADVEVSVSRALPPRLRPGSFATMAALRTRTDASGRFEIPGIPAVDQLSLAASLDDGSRGRVAVPPAGTRAAVGGLDIVLDRPASLTAILQDPAGNPVTKTAVDVDQQDAASPGRSGTFFWTRGASQVKVDAAGKLTLSGLPAGDGTLTLRAPGFAPYSVDPAKLIPGETLDLGTVKLDPGRTITGRVRDEDGALITGASVHSRRYTPGAFTNIEAETDSEGRYVLAGVGDQKLTVSVTSEGRARGEIADVAPDTEGVDFTLKKAGGLTARIVTGDPPRPVTSFFARAEQKDSARPGRVVFDTAGGSRAFSDPGGQLRLAGLSPGEYTLEVSANGFVPQTLTGVQVEPGGTADAGTIRLETGGTVTGRVIDTAGSPVAGAAISLRPSSMFRFGDDNGPTAIAGLDGRFVLKGVAAGSQTIVAEQTGYAKSEAPTRVDPAVPPEEISFVLGRGGKLTGTVHDEQGAPQAGVLVAAFTMADPMGVSPVTTDGSGVFAFEGLRPGTYNVMKAGGSSSGGRRTMMIGTGMDSKQVEVKDGETVVVNIGGERTIKVAGTLRRSAGPVPNARLFWAPVPADGEARMPSAMRSATTDASGRYEVALPQAGAWSVSVTEEEMPLSASTSFEVDIPKDTDQLSKDLVYPAGVLTGIVLRASDNTPVEGAQVRAARESETAATSTPGRRTPGGSGKSDATGRYRIEGLTEGSYKVTVEAEGLASETSAALKVKGNGESGANFTLDPAAYLRLRAIDPDGRPLRDAYVSVLDDSGTIRLGGRGSVATAADGTARIGGLKPGPCTIMLISRDVPLTITKDILVPKEGDGEVEIRVPAGGSLDLRIQDAAGKSVSGVTPGITDPSGVDLAPLMPALRMLAGLPAATGADGSIRFPSLAPGKYAVTATRGGEHASGTVEVQAGQNATLKLSLN